MNNTEDKIENKEKEFIISEKFKFDEAFNKINLHRETYAMKSDDKKTRRKNTMLAFVAGAAGVGLVAHPKTRKILLNSGKNIAIGAVKNGMKVL